MATAEGRPRRLTRRSSREEADRCSRTNTPLPLAGDDQALIAQDAHGLLDGHPGNAVALGKLSA
jgi:hypothetical protein